MGKANFASGDRVLQKEPATMAITRMDVVRLLDIDLSEGRRIPDLRKVLQAKSPSETYLRYVDSFGWLFDPQEVPGNNESNPTTRYLSQEVNCAHSLPGFDRFSLDRDIGDPSDRGGVITVSRNLRAAVVCIWNEYDGGADALGIKISLETDIPTHYLKQLSTLFPHIAEAELMYPFLAVRYDGADLQQLLANEGVFLGRLFSGGLDHEADATLKHYITDNVSIRGYEGLFVRSSDGLGVYTSQVEKDPVKDLHLYENTLFRAVQVCEICLLEHRLLRSLKSRIDRDAKKVRTLPRPLLVEKRRSELLALEMGLVKALPFRTPEAPPLIRKAQERFNIPQSLQDAKDSYNFLETRYQNTKSTALAMLAVFTYALDKMGLWKWLGAVIQGYINLLLHAQKHLG
jgi:hypothetical protein